MTFMTFVNLVFIFSFVLIEKKKNSAKSMHIGDFVWEKAV